MKVDEHQAAVPAAGSVVRSPSSHRSGSSNSRSDTGNACVIAPGFMVSRASSNISVSSSSSGKARVDTSHESHSLRQTEKEAAVAMLQLHASPCGSFSSAESDGSRGGSERAESSEMIRWDAAAAPSAYGASAYVLPPPMVVPTSSAVPCPSSQREKQQPSQNASACAATTDTWTVSRRVVVHPPEAHASSMQQPEENRISDEESESSDDEDDDAAATALMSNSDQAIIIQHAMTTIKKKRNRRERLRWRKIRRGFSHLREKLPRGEFEELSQLSTLRRAARYIHYLSRLADTGEEDVAAAAMVCEDVDDHSLCVTATRAAAAKHKQQQKQQQQQQQHQPQQHVEQPATMVLAGDRRHDNGRHVFCSACRTSHDHQDNRITLCGQCRSGFHRTCHTPHIPAITNGHIWRCGRCSMMSLPAPVGGVVAAHAPPHQPTPVPYVYVERAPTATGQAADYAGMVPKDGAHMPAPIPRYIFAPPHGQPGMPPGPMTMMNFHPVMHSGVHPTPAMAIPGTPAGVQMPPAGALICPGQQPPPPQQLRAVQLIPMPMASHRAPSPRHQQHAMHVQRSAALAQPNLLSTATLAPAPSTTPPGGMPSTVQYKRQHQKHQNQRQQQQQQHNQRRPPSNQSHTSSAATAKSSASRTRWNGSRPLKLNRLDTSDMTVNEVIALFRHISDTTMSRLTANRRPPVGMPPLERTAAHRTTAAAATAADGDDDVKFAPPAPLPRPSSATLIAKTARREVESRRASVCSPALSAHVRRSSRARHRDPSARSSLPRSRSPMLTEAVTSSSPPLRAAAATADTVRRHHHHRRGKHGRRADSQSCSSVHSSSSGGNSGSSSSITSSGTTSARSDAIAVGGAADGRHGKSNGKVQLCAGCGAVSEFYCSVCQSVSYCSRACQERSWRLHCTSCIHPHLQSPAQAMARQAHAHAQAQAQAQVHAPPAQAQAHFQAA